MKLNVFSFALWVLPFSLFAQNKSALSLNVEFSSNYTNASINESWPIRQDVSTYSNDYSFGSYRIATDFQFTQLGVRPEYTFARDKISVSTGIRFTQFGSEIAKSDADNGGFFYLRYGNEDFTTQYARVKKMNEKTSYLGLPFEIKITPFRWLKLAPYFRAGTEIGFRLNTSTDITFENVEMKENQQQIINEHGFVPNAIFSTMYSAVGLSLGATREINYNIEFLLPSFFLSTKNSSLMNTDEFSGVRLSMSFPLSKKL